MTEPTHLLLPGQRWERWAANFADRHAGAAWAPGEGVLMGEAPDGAWVRVRAPFDRPITAADPAALAATLTTLLAPPEQWGMLLVRKGGFAVARLAGGEQQASKVGRRHVQGRTKAGGQSQQRFARRRDNQARAAFQAAADHAAALLGGTPNLPVVLGGDRAAVAEVLTDPRLRGLVPLSRWLAVPEPRRDTLLGALAAAAALELEIRDPNVACQVS